MWRHACSSVGMAYAGETKCTQKDRCMHARGDGRVTITVAAGLALANREHSAQNLLRPAL